MKRILGIAILVFVGLLLESALAVIYIREFDSIKYGLINLLIAHAIVVALGGLIYLATRLMK